MMSVLAGTLLLVAGVNASAQHRADRQELTTPGSSTFILLGDPQGYIKYDLNQPLFELCTAWIADNVDQLNIKGVLCTGDLVEQNDNNALNRRMLNQSSRQMWENVSRSFERIDGKVPYMISPGNHDYGYKAAEDIHSFFPDYFSFERQGDVLKETLVAEHPTRYGRASIENGAFEFELPGWDRKVLVISSEFSPSDNVLNWAKKLCLSDKYKDHVVIFLTHSYMQSTKKYNNVRIGKEGYGLCQDETNNCGEKIWEKLINEVPNIRMVICGHSGYAEDPEDFKTSIGWRVDKDKAGKNVYQMMFNVQTLGGGWEGNGGDGWLRILEFMPDGKTVKVRTYSPLFGISKRTKHLAHRTDKSDRFEFVIER